MNTQSTRLKTRTVEQSLCSKVSASAELAEALGATNRLVFELAQPAVVADFKLDLSRGDVLPGTASMHVLAKDAVVVLVVPVWPHHHNIRFTTPDHLFALGAPIVPLSFTVPKVDNSPIGCFAFERLFPARQGGAKENKAHAAPSRVGSLALYSCLAYKSIKS